MTKSEKAVQLVCEGYSYAEAAREIGCSWGLVRGACDASGVTQTRDAEIRSFQSSLNGRFIRNDNRDRNAQIERLLIAATHTYSEIAKEAGCSRCVVAGVAYRMKRRAA